MGSEDVSCPLGCGEDAHLTAEGIPAHLSGECPVALEQRVQSKVNDQTQMTDFEGEP